jgi:zinc transporter 13
LELLLSVAVGSQLGDVFLHLLPEAFSHPHASSLNIGLWTLVGLFVFFLIEQIFPDESNQNESSISTERKIKVFLYFFILFC